MVGIIVLKGRHRTTPTESQDAAALRPQTAATLAVHGNSWQFIDASDSSGGTGKGVPMAHKIHKFPAQCTGAQKDAGSTLRVGNSAGDL